MRTTKMAMSKKCFVFVLCLFLAVVVGAIAFVAIKIYGNAENTSGDEKQAVAEEIVTAEYKALTPRKARMMCGAIINGTEPSLGAYNHPSMFNGVLGVNAISLRVLTSSSTGDTYQKCAYWLEGDSYADRDTISMIRADACKGKVPVIVIAMRPSKGLKVSRNIQLWNHYKPDPLLESWEEYDKKLNSYLKFLAPVPSIIVLEPDLLMSTFDTHNMQYGWLNDKYKEEFFQRAQRVIKVMSRSWVYVDAGNAAYLNKLENMEHMSKSLLRLEGLRGFSINTAHFFNTSYNNMIARRLHCLTGLHYITDTSRNGGRFSRQSVLGIEQCHFDPPQMLAGLPPGWSWGTKLSPRQKRWTPDFNQNENVPPSQQSPQTSPTSQYPNNNVIIMPKRPPNPQEDPEKYNQWINEMKNSGAHSQNSDVYNFPQQGSVPQSQPSNYQPANPINHNTHSGNQGNGQNTYNDLSTPSGRVGFTAITAPPRRQTVRNVELRNTAEALAIFRSKKSQRSRCLRTEAVSVHDANVWIKTPGEADGRLYEYGTYHKCLIGHSEPCGERCRLFVHSQQRSSDCGCGQTNSANSNQGQQPQQPNQSQNANDGIFFSNSNGIQQTNGGGAYSNQNPNSGTQNNNQNQNGNQPPFSGQSTGSSLEDLLQQGK